MVKVEEMVKVKGVCKRAIKSAIKLEYMFNEKEVVKVKKVVKEKKVVKVKRI